MLQVLRDVPHWRVREALDLIVERMEEYVPSDCIPAAKVIIEYIEET